MKKTVVMAGLAVGSLLLAACGGGSDGGGEGGGSGPTELNVAINTDLSTGDPSLTGSPSDMNVLVNIYDSLTTRAESGELEPGLATSWELVNPTTWQFTLREGVEFHNGEPFNSEAVKFSIERIINNPESPIQELRDVKEVRTPDELTVEVETNNPDPLMPGRLALFAGLVVPPDYVAENGEEALVNEPVGTGPYSLESWQRGSQIELTANEGYWGDAPEIDQVTVRFIPDDTTRIAALMNNEVDLINAVPPTAKGQIEGNGTLRLDVADGIRISYVSLANQDGPLADPDVRRALSYAVDYDALIESLLAGHGERISAPLASTTAGAELAPEPYEHDLQKAQDLLNKAGYANGFEVEFDTQAGLDQQLALAVKDMWAKVGVTANVEPLAEDIYDQRYEEGKLDAVWNNGYSVWQGDPTVLIDTFFHTGRPRDRFGTPEFDKLIDTISTETDETARNTAMTEVLQTLNDEAPWIYLFQANDLYGVQQDVEWTVPFNQLLRFNTVSLTS